jgi:fucose permease
VDVAMNAQGVAVQRLMGRPVLSGMHAMHSLGGVLGAGAGALAARLGVEPSLHFLACGVVAVVGGLGVTPVLLPSRADAEEDPSGGGSASTGGLRRWFSGWSAPIALLGGLAFCFTLAEGAGLNWSAIYVADSLGTTESLGAIGLGVFLGAVTLGRLVGDRLVSRFGSVRVFRAGAVVAGLGFGGALLVDAPIAGLVGLGLLGAGIANALPLAIAAGGNAPDETPATAAARVSTLGYMGSFVGPVLVGGLASVFSLPLALGLPALLILATAFGARAVRRAG